MSISQEEITKTAQRLSKIQGDDPRLVSKISSTLSYFELLEELDTKDVAPTYNVINNALKLRDDEIKESKVSPQDLLSCSNQKVVSGQIVLPSIM